MNNYRKVYIFSKKHLREQASKSIAFRLGKMTEKVRQSLCFSRDYLEHITRKKIENYSHHGLRVSKALREVAIDPSLHAIALLHDILNHPQGKELLRQSPLGQDEQSVIKGLHALRNLQIDINKPDLEKVIKAFSNDHRLLLIRMAHRLSDVRGLPLLDKKIAKKVARETLHMYAPLADRMGLRRWRYEMEDLCFNYLYPDIAGMLEKQFKGYEKNDWFCLRHTRRYLSARLKRAGIDCQIEGRIKSLYSTYRKIVHKNISFDKVLDRLALRIIVKTDDDCYRALGIIHLSMHPIIGNLQDYIASPKENGYRSIHTVVYPLPQATNRPMEIQIRTEKMHEECENGIASHLEYKLKNYSMRYSSRIKVDLLRNLEIIRSEIHSTKDFTAALKKHIRGKKVMVFDGDNHIYHLKSPTGALDFIFIVHGKNTAYLKQIKINGIISSPGTILGDGDVVEAEFQKKKSATKQWKFMCLRRTSKELLKHIT